MKRLFYIAGVPFRCMEHEAEGIYTRCMMLDEWKRKNWPAVAHQVRLWTEHLAPVQKISR